MLELFGISSVAVAGRRSQRRTETESHAGPFSSPIFWVHTQPCLEPWKGFRCKSSGSGLKSSQRVTQVTNTRETHTVPLLETIVGREVYIYTETLGLCGNI